MFVLCSCVWLRSGDLPHGRLFFDALSNSTLQSDAIDDSENTAAVFRQGYSKFQDEHPSVAFIMQAHSLGAVPAAANTFASAVAMSVYGAHKRGPHFVSSLLSAVGVAGGGGRLGTKPGDNELCSRMGESTYHASRDLSQCFGRPFHVYFIGEDDLLHSHQLLVDTVAATNTSIRVLILERCSLIFRLYFYCNAMYHLHICRGHSGSSNTPEFFCLMDLSMLNDPTSAARDMLIPYLAKQSIAAFDFARAAFDHRFVLKCVSGGAISGQDCFFSSWIYATGNEWVFRIPDHLTVVCIMLIARCVTQAVSLIHYRMPRCVSGLSGQLKS